MALLGLIGGPLIFASGIAVLLGAYTQLSPISAIATVPEFAWELSLGIYLIVKGFEPSPINPDTPTAPGLTRRDGEPGIPAPRHGDGLVGSAHPAELP